MVAPAVALDTRARPPWTLSLSQAKHQKAGSIIEGGMVEPTNNIQDPAMLPEQLGGGGSGRHEWYLNEGSCDENAWRSRV